MGLMKHNSWTHNYFKRIEKRYYQLSDKIGVMSPANKDYLIRHNFETIHSEKVEICPNCIKLRHLIVENQSIVSKNEKIKLVYGGNLGIPQAISFLIEILTYYINDPKIEFEIIVSGTEYPVLEHWVKLHSPTNVKLFPHLPQTEFRLKVLKSDIGLIFLSHKFTIPNFPSRLLTYLESNKPVLCFTDEITDIGKIAKENNFGDWAPSNDLSDAVKLINQYLLQPKTELKRMGENGYQYLLNHYTSIIAYDSIINSYKKVRNL